MNQNFSGSYDKLFLAMKENENNKTPATTTHICQLVHNTIVAVCYCWWWWYFCYPYHIVSRFSRNLLLCLTINIIFLPLSDAFLLFFSCYLSRIAGITYGRILVHATPCSTSFILLPFVRIHVMHVYAFHLCHCESWQCRANANSKSIQQEHQTLWRRKSNINAD